MSSKSLRKLAYDSMYRPGIDLAVLIAVASATLDAVSLLSPWLVGINSSYSSSKGLTYTVSALLSGLNILFDMPFIAVVFLPIILTGVLVFVSLRPEGLIQPRIGYKTKSRVILVLGIALISPTFHFPKPVCFRHQRIETGPVRRALGNGQWCYNARLRWLRLLVGTGVQNAQGLNYFRATGFAVDYRPTISSVSRI